MAEQVLEYKCPACTGPLHFDSESGKLTCDYCGSSYTVEEIEGRERFFAGSKGALLGYLLPAGGLG